MSRLPKELQYNPMEKYGGLSNKIFNAPLRYVQGPCALQHIGLYIQPFQYHTVIVVLSPNRMKDQGKTIQESLQKYKAAQVVEFLEFHGECTWEEFTRINQKIDTLHIANTYCLIGVGGGTNVDCVRAIAYLRNVSFISVPTLASNDAPCSALSVFYTQQGEFLEYVFYPRNPSLVLVDTDIIAKAPRRFFVSGMGDAMATYYEAASCWKAEHAVTCAGGRPTATAEALGRLCKDLLFTYGRQAAKDLDCQPLQVTEAIERVTEANTLLSGLGFESGGLAAAHAVHNGLTAHHATKAKYHGEKVAFGTLVHLCLENNLQEAFKVAQFFHDTGLPVTLEELGIKENDVEGIRKVAERTCAKGETIYHLPNAHEIHPDWVYQCILKANRLGKEVVNK
ncbi:hypothetical protein GpartN1_g7734.t1 [Galdieria partita]|uniref:Glycerol dehydrogenase n=1 Tax=Galdieria partita TaxID=83374 RepID=A0A9C7Q3Q6_9RHOD|nr:hypothetical protein GpartN1_g7734.t1 [Galdieria partita]